MANLLATCLLTYLLGVDKDESLLCTVLACRECGVSGSDGVWVYIHGCVVHARLLTPGRAGVCRPAVLSMALGFTLTSRFHARH